MSEYSGIASLHGEFVACAVDNCYAHYFTGFAGSISPQGGQLSQINPLKTESRAINPLTSNVQ